MKKQKFLLGAAGLFAIGLTACSNEVPVNNDVATEAQTRYLRVAISNTASTRADADDFENGTDEENAIADILLKFFDASGNPLNEIKSTPVDKTGWSNSTGSVGKFKEAVMELAIPRGSGFPAYVMCYINPVDYADDMDSESMYELRNEERDGYTNPAGAFAMNNASYYGENKYTGAANVKISATPIELDQLYTTAADATAADAEHTVEIYVERYAAKVNFSLTQTAESIKDQTVGDYTLTFVPEKWTVNADAETMYVVKRFSDTDKETQTIPTMAAVQATFPGWTTWNDEANHRSYWACSPGYYAEDFPEVSDDIIDQVEGTGTGAGELVGNYKLRYYSYNQIVGSAEDSEGSGMDIPANNTKNWKYVLENTMGRAAFNCQNPKAAAPSVLLLGHYTVKKGNDVVTNNDGFCIYNDRLYYRNTIPAGDADGKLILDALMDANNILFINQNIGTNSVMNSTNSANVKDYFEVIHPTKAVRDLQGTPTPHRYVTLQLKSGLASYDGLYYRPMGTDRRVPVTAEVVNQLNLQLWSQIGVARAYTQGKCYFSIPIRHLGYYENTAGYPTEDETENGVIEWREKVRVGDFGLVRNHVYDIEVQRIDGMASGIEDLDNPLVPSMEDNLRNIKYRINILNWRIVNPQTGIIL